MLAALIRGFVSPRHTFHQALLYPWNMHSNVSFTRLEYAFHTAEITFNFFPREHAFQAGFPNSPFPRPNPSFASRPPRVPICH